MSVRPFPETLRAIRFGELQEEISEQLATLVKVCAETGKVGTLKLSVKLKPGKAGQMEVIDDLTVTPPKPEKGTSIFFVTPEGNLQREDPRQMEIKELRDVSAATSTTELRSVSA